MLFADSTAGTCAWCCSPVLHKRLQLALALCVATDLLWMLLSGSNSFEKKLRFRSVILVVTLKICSIHMIFVPVMAKMLFRLSTLFPGIIRNFSPFPRYEI